jgi:hypothetical protein
MSKAWPKCLFYLIPIFLLLVAPSGWTTATVLGKTKPNVSIIDEKYRPPKKAKKNKDHQTARRLLVQLSEKNELLAIELGKLPDLQDGISASEVAALRGLVKVYDRDADAFDNAFRQMYQIGKPEVRKFCSPLQALFWLAQKDIEETRKQLEYFQLNSLLDASWDFQEGPTLTLSEQEAKKVIDSIKSDEQRKEYYAFLDRINVLNSDRIEVLNGLILLEYKKNPYGFSREARKIIKYSQKWKEELKWKDPKKVIDRLNSPELLDYYINRNIGYKHIIPAFHRSPRSVINEKYGDCDDLAYFGKTVLTKAGYDVFGRYLNKGIGPGHIGLGIRLEDGSYFLAVDFNGTNHMSGPYKTLLEFDQALGYGALYKKRDPFFFDW